MVDYDRAVVSAGIEKSRLEAENDQKRKEIKQLNISRNLILESMRRDKSAFTEGRLSEIELRSTTLVDYESRVTDAKKFLKEVDNKKHNLEIGINNHEAKIKSLENEIEYLDGLRQKSNDEIFRLVKVGTEKNNEINRLNSVLINLKNQESVLLNEKNKFAKMVKETTEELDKKNKELVELNEIISILQSSNKQGLDITASFEGERKRLQEKEDFLLRKESDLAIYEKRLEKKIQEIGLNIKMIFQ